jgi:hypothetical protein
MLLVRTPDLDSGASDSLNTCTPICHAQRCPVHSLSCPLLASVGWPSHCIETTLARELQITESESESSLQSPRTQHKLVLRPSERLERMGCNTAVQ